jgi:hypothetical protein
MYDIKNLNTANKELGLALESRKKLIESSKKLFEIMYEVYSGHRCKKIPRIGEWLSTKYVDFISNRIKAIVEEIHKGKDLSFEEGFNAYIPTKEEEYKALNFEVMDILRMYGMQLEETDQ